MKSSFLALAIAIPASLVCVQAIGGCATGTDPDPAVDFLGTQPVKDSGPKEQPAPSVKLNPPSNPTPPDENINEDEDAGTGEQDAGAPDTGTADSGADTGAPDSGTGTPGSCTATNTCMAAADLGTVSGDTGADTKSAQGYTSQWFTVRVTEDDSSITGIELWMTASLVSPAGTNYDLFVYTPGSDTRECSAISHSSTSTGSTDTTTAKMGETSLFSNGSDDSRTLTVEVRHISGTCDPTKKWTLNLEGNK